MKFEINSLHEIGDIAYLKLSLEKVKVVDITLEREYNRYCVKYLVEFENETRTWVYEWSLEVK